MNNYQKIISLLFLAFWILLAINPNDRPAWLLENIIIVLTLPLIYFFSKRGYVSNLSASLILIFLALHTVGSHYAYDKVPFGQIVGEWFQTDRNSYDRLVHFSFGLLLALPIYTFLTNRLHLNSLWPYFFSLAILLSLSASYEIFEWLVAFQVNPLAAESFMGSQGDFWDTQKDMALAILGAFLSLLGYGLTKRFIGPHP